MKVFVGGFWNVHYISFNNLPKKICQWFPTKNVSIDWGCCEIWFIMWKIQNGPISWAVKNCIRITIVLYLLDLNVYLLKLCYLGIHPWARGLRLFRPKPEGLPEGFSLNVSKPKGKWMRPTLSCLTQVFEPDLKPSGLWYHN